MRLSSFTIYNNIKLESIHCEYDILLFMNRLL